MDEIWDRFEGVIGFYYNWKAVSKIALEGNKEYIN